MSSPVEKIKARLGIVEVVGYYLKLEKSGSNFKARCPFHNEKTPSFYVSPGRESYHCFGCNQGGDILSFVQAIEGVDFIGALKILAERAGVELGPVDVRLKSEQERLYSILERATKFYEQQLAVSDAPVEYLHKRGLSDETIKSFRIGFSPDAWQTVLDKSLQAGYTAEEIEKTGLIIKTEASIKHPRGRYYDRFRNRIMFPITDPSGRVIGYSGRTLSTEPTQAKYINSPQTELYDKSTALFGYDKAKLEIKRQDFCILVEGQMDLVMSHQAGFANTIAVSGTALTERHLTTIKRLTDKLVMVFDGDPAGITAARRAIKMALKLDMDVRAALLPEGQDPADVILKDPSLWSKAIEESKNIIIFHLDVLQAQNYDLLTLNKKVTEQILPYMTIMSSSTQCAYYVSLLANILKIKEEPIWEELNKIKGKSEFDLELADSVKKEEVSTKNKTRLDMMFEQVIGFLWWQENKAEKDIDTVGFKNAIEKITGIEVFQNKIKELEPIREQVLLQAELSFDGKENLDKEAAELERGLALDWRRRELDDLMNKIKMAEMSGEGDKIDAYLKKCQDISKEINDLKK